jgi:hypothetical protein
MAAIKSHTTTDCPFDFWTDIDSSAAFSITAPASVRGCLGGMDGSLLDTYGGEYEWDMYTALLHGHRGADHGVKIVYGKNLIDFKMERSIENIDHRRASYWETQRGLARFLNCRKKGSPSVTMARMKKSPSWTAPVTSRRSQLRRN